MGCELAVLRAVSLSAPSAAGRSCRRRDLDRHAAGVPSPPRGARSACIRPLLLVTGVAGLPPTVSLRCSSRLSLARQSYRCRRKRRLSNRYVLTTEDTKTTRELACTCVCEIMCVLLPLRSGMTGGVHHRCGVSPIVEDATVAVMRACVKPSRWVASTCDPTQRRYSFRSTCHIQQRGF